MKTLNKTTQIKLTILAGVVLLLASCGTSKSSHPDNTLSSTTTATSQALASCNSRSTADMSANLSIYKYSNGTVDPRVIKLKFNSLSSELTQSGNIIRFFKWKVYQGQAVMDQTPLNVTRYSLSTQQMDTQTQTSVATTTISTLQGFYVDLNDSTLSHQVLKMAVYSSAGVVLKQMDILIPEFKASPTDYAYNSDGTMRSQNLINLHPLTGADVTGWTTQNYTNFFNSKCF